MTAVGASVGRQAEDLYSIVQIDLFLVLVIPVIITVVLRQIISGAPFSLPPPIPRSGAPDVERGLVEVHRAGPLELSPALK